MNVRETGRFRFDDRERFEFRQKLWLHRKFPLETQNNVYYDKLHFRCNSLLIVFDKIHRSGRVIDRRIIYRVQNINDNFEY